MLKFQAGFLVIINRKSYALKSIMNKLVKFCAYSLVVILMHLLLEFPIRGEDTRHDDHDYECVPLNGEAFESAPEGSFECLLL